MKEELFTFADERRWTTPKLEQRFTDLQETENADYLSKTRKAQITREMCHIAFEGLQRRKETNLCEAEIEYLENKYEIFTSQRYTNQGDEPTQWKRAGVE